MKSSNYIAGQWVEGTGSFNNINPSDTSDQIDSYTSATAEQFEQAVQAAIKAQKEWESVGIEKKSQILIKIGDELIAKSKELGELLSREEGKPLAEGIGEVARAGQQFQYYGSECLRLYGERIPSTRPGFQVEISREPLGVIGIISPWNFPIAIPAWKVAPAMMCGNAVILKPASLTPASAIELTKIIANQDIPDGLFNLVLGSGGDIGNKIATHKDIVAISFTGSVDVGRKLYQDASPFLKKMQMEMGSKNPLVVMEDADLKTAIACAANGAYGGTGQKCTASSRLIVHENLYDDFVKGLIDNIILDQIVDKFGSIFKSEFIFPISITNPFNLDNLLDKIIELSPEGNPYFSKDQITDKSERFFVNEIIREKILNHYDKEIPYSVEVETTSFKPSSKIIKIESQIYVERSSQKGILIGHKGNNLKIIGTKARTDLEQFFQKKVFIDLKVKVLKNWKSEDKHLKRFGYDLG